MSCIGMSPADRSLHCLVSFPDTVACIGSTDGWVAITDAADNMHTTRYYLHNMFSAATVSLPDLDAAIDGHVSQLFEIRKVLLRSTQDDVIAVMTNHHSCPIILTRIGKGVWLPKSYAPALVGVVDVAFLVDRLYGITHDGDLVFLDIAFDDSGVPTVTSGKCVIGEDDDDDDDNDGHVDNEEDNDSIGHEDEYHNNNEVFEANMSAAMWVPVKGGLKGQSLFISTPFSKSVSACNSVSGEIEKDVIYFADRDDVFDMRSETVRPHRTGFDWYNICLRATGYQAGAANLGLLTGDR
ncbi:hypothetical protein ZWY2020_029919 [Hordeum vulgare]|nr:hypothetical protein ZWY2020_029919 [Hordeum vulgare]